MELKEIDQIADVANILGYVRRVIDRLKSHKDSVTGKKLSYLERSYQIIHDLETRLDNIAVERTSMLVLQDIRTKIVELESATNPSVGELDYGRIHELSDIILRQVPFIITKGTDDPVKIKARGDEVNTIATNATNQINGETNRVVEVADAKIAEIENKIRQIDKLSNFVAGKALSGEFASHAQTESTAAILWTIITAILGVATIVLLIIFFLMQLGIISQLSAGSLNGDANFSIITTKILITLSLGLLTRWTSKRANHHLGQVTLYNRLSLSMNSLESFVAELAPENKDRVIAYVTARLLVDETSSDPGSDFDSFNWSDLIKSFNTKAG